MFIISTCFERSSLPPRGLLTFHSIPANMIDGRCGADNSMHDMFAIFARELFTLHPQCLTAASFIRQCGFKLLESSSSDTTFNFIIF